MTARNRKLVVDVLRSARFRTLGAVTAGAGIDLASEHLPDVILMDLRLPDSGRVDTTRIFIAVPRTSRIPVVAFTALPLDAGEDWLLDAGFAGCVVKPIDIDEFPEQVRRFCAPGPPGPDSGGNVSTRCCRDASIPRDKCRQARLARDRGTSYVARSGRRRSAGSCEAVPADRPEGGRDEVQVGVGRRARRRSASRAYAGTVLATPSTRVRRDHAREGDNGEIFSHVHTWVPAVHGAS